MKIAISAFQFTFASGLSAHLQNPFATSLFGAFGGWRIKALLRQPFNSLFRSRFGKTPSC
jgi:hypothetical protein